MLRLLVRSTRFAGRGARIAFVLGLIGLNVATLTVSGVYTALSGALSAVGITTVAAREAMAQTQKKAAARQIARRTKSRVTKRIRVQAARNSTSVFAEAIPFVGVAVIAGSLVYEIRDSCDTARDITALLAAVEADADPDRAHAEAEAEFNCVDVIEDSISVPDADAIWQQVMDSPKAAWDASSAYYDDLTATDWAARMRDTMAAIARFGANSWSWAPWDEGEDNR